MGEGHAKSQDNFAEIVLAFEDPEFYPHPVSKIERRETHISVVFLTGELVYKIKKPVNFGFLNYETPELRKFYCHQEVRLNKRLAEDVYLRVEKICLDGRRGKFYLGDCESPVEHAVVMKELPQEESLEHYLLGNMINESILEKIGLRLADFYGRASVSDPHFTKYGGVEYVRFNAYENIHQLLPFAREVGGVELLKWLKEAIYAFTVRYRSLFNERVSNGYVVDGHGDLRAEHIYIRDGIQILDCIEFNNRLRFGDVAVDLAFLFMDLCRLGFEDVAYAVLDKYCVKNGDFQFWGLLDFYTAYRALVRAKVACLETLSCEAGLTGPAFEKARKFMRLGTEHTAAYGLPTVVILMGLPASGKSRLAARIRDDFHWEYLSTDEIRKRLDPGVRVSPFGAGDYSEDRRSRIYEIMAKSTADLVERGRSVVVDGTFSRACWRELFLKSLDEAKCHIIMIEAVASPEVLKERLMCRESGNQKELSDARLEHLEPFIRSYEPPDEVPHEKFIRVSTDTDFELSVAYLTRELYRKRLNQAREWAACQRSFPSP
ncbi:AAA family ATPase [Thermodesulforhabdus norvegica]|uniref:Aminoglycoside phosphotransferase domain-containing protein n=1 Tax=Thermodesulforhabdus norvegica TaxID=39841 RepID=A0A1I4S412_9BACT|nr:bifunctional aminoglycoside phosphotransferase/ATP-binding protein [Thermodesulforhabdus norvegica]SFM59232.1 hypothetical protein SAMN05660836_00743 [Thermodesulforhabdus norvegica]